MIILYIILHYIDIVLCLHFSLCFIKGSYIVSLVISLLPAMQIELFSQLNCFIF